MSNNEVKTDICVIGGGLAGLTASLRLASSGSEVVICAPRQTRKDPRTTALLMHSIAFFEDLGIWQSLSKKAYPLKTMRIVDGTSRLIRAPQTDFIASEINLDAFGYNLRNQDIIEVLETEIRNHPKILQIDGTISDIKIVDTKEILTVKTKDGSTMVCAGFIVGADGRNSIVRRKKEVSVREWAYPQSALVVDFEHKRGSEFTSTEFHTESGPFTVVPHSNNIAGLVWMETPNTVDELLKLADTELETVLERKMQSFLGKIKLVSKPQSFPIRGMVANSFGDANWAIVGEAAHVFPPIGAQGFNLGIRDIETLTAVLMRYTDQENRGRQYDNARKHDINTRTYGVDLLNRSLLSDFLPIQILRGLGLHVLGSFKPLKKYAMKMGISPKI